MGDIRELANSIKEFGQIQPAVIVPSSDKFISKDKDTSIEYIVIAGRRRREACHVYNLKYLACLHQDIDVETALEIQRIENEEREDISDFSEGISYYQAIKDGKASHKKLFEKSASSKAKITMLLSYGNIKDNFSELYDAVEDFRKISSRVAYDILSYAKKGKSSQLIKLSCKLRSGTIGSRKLKKLVEELPVSKDKKTYSHDKIKYMTLLGDKLTIDVSKFANNSIIEAIDSLLLTQIKKENINE